MSGFHKTDGSITESSVNYGLITGVLFWAGLTVLSSLYLTIPLIPEFSRVFAAAPTAAVWTGSAFSFSFAAGCLVYGPLSDKLGRKTVILAGLAVLSVVFVCTGFVNNLSVLIFCRGLQGLAAASFSPVSLAYVADTFPVQKRVTGIGFISSGFLMAGVVGQVVSSYISGRYGWNTVFYMFGIVYIVTFFLILWLVPKHSGNQAGIGIGRLLGQMKSLLKQKNLVYAYVIALTLLLSFVGMYTALSSYLSSPLFSLSGQQILYVRMAGIAGMLLSPFSGTFVAKMGSFFVLRGGLSMSGLGLLLLGISRNLPLSVAASMIFVAGIAVVIPAIIDLIGRLGGKLRGAAISIYTFVLFVGASIGPILATAVLKQEHYSLTFFTLALCLGAAFCISFLFHGSSKSLLSHSR